MSTTRQAISVGSAANDGTGDTLRLAGQKINANFGQIYNLLGADSDTLSTKVALVDSAVSFTPGSNSVFLSAQPTITGARDIRLPDASGVITLNTASQTLTNKSVELNDAILNNSDVNGAGTIANSTNPYIRAEGTGYTVTLANASAGEIGKLKVFTYTGTGTLAVTVTSGSNFNLTEDQSKICIWTGTEWIQLT